MTNRKNGVRDTALISADNILLKEQNNDQGRLLASTVVPAFGR